MKRAALIAIAAACSSKAPAARPVPPPDAAIPDAVVAEPDRPPPDVRLPGDVHPIRYALDLTIDPTQASFTRQAPAIHELLAKY